SRSGLTVKLDDTDGAAKVTISDKEGKNLIELDAGKSTISITSGKDLILTAKGNISLESSGGDVSIKGKNVTLEGQQALAAKGGSGKPEATNRLDITCAARANDEKV